MWSHQDEKSTADAKLKKSLSNILTKLKVFSIGWVKLNRQLLRKGERSRANVSLFRSALNPLLITSRLNNCTTIKFFYWRFLWFKFSSPEIFVNSIRSCDWIDDAAKPTDDSMIKHFQYDCVFTSFRQNWRGNNIVVVFLRTWRYTFQVLQAQAQIYEIVQSLFILQYKLTVLKQNADTKFWAPEKLYVVIDSS